MYSSTSINEFLESAPEGLLMGFFASISISWIIISVVLSILLIIAFWIVFKKAGKHGWASIIPIYNIVVLFQIAGLSPWLILLLVFPIINIIPVIVFAILIPFRTAKAFGRGTGFGFGLWLLPPIFYLILAFGTSEYVGLDK